MSIKRHKRKPNDLAVRRKLRLRLPIYEFLRTINNEYLNASQNTQRKDIEGVAQFISKQRPASNTLIDQCPITPIDLARRVELILEYLPLMKDRKILFVGDDDLASAVLNKIDNNCLITLLDIDERIIDVIRKNCDKNCPRLIKKNLIDIMDGKVGDPLLEEVFDCFVTDPPYTEAGYRYFLGYGLNHLKSSGIALIAVPHMNLEEWSDELLYKVETLLLESGCLIERILPAFALYEHEDAVISSMIIAKKVTKAHFKWSAQNGNRVYTTGYEL